MKNYSNFIFLFCISLFWSCKSEQFSNKVKITVNATNSKGQAVAIKSMNMLSGESITLKESKLDSSGLAKLEFDLPNTQFVQIQVGEKTNALLLSPSDDLDITLDLKDADSKPVFKGKAAEASNYLNQSTNTIIQFQQLGGKNFSDLDTASFVTWYDSLNHTYSNFHKAFLDTTKTNKNICNLLEKRNKAITIFHKQMYVLTQFGATKRESEIPFFFKNIKNEVPFDTTLLNSNLFDYANVLNGFLLIENENFFRGKNAKEINSTIENLPMINSEKIKNSTYPHKIKEHLLGLNFMNSCFEFGTNDSTKKIYENFIKFSKSSDYSNTVQKIYTKFDSLSTGKPAPEITGLSPTGEKIALSDFKGKLIYIDVWATWCGPCREELPKTRLIEKKYKGNNQVVFMYVSVDRDTEAWRTLLKKDKSFSGVQINNPDDGKHKSIGEKYMIGGIPRYILIDQKGNIINSFAPKPSSGKVEALIDQQLGLL